MVKLAATAACALAAALPASAGAATVDVREMCDLRPCGIDYLTVEDESGAGEPNTVGVALTSDGRYRVTDSSAELTPADESCMRETAYAVTCHRRPDAGVRMTLRLGGGDDRLAAPTIPGAQVSIDGGPGADHLEGTRVGTNFLAGGAGDDVLIGGPINNAFGADEGADQIRGGTGLDGVTYYAVAGPVHVDLSTATPAGVVHAQGDVLSGIENLSGSNGDDILIGDGGPNGIDGAEGADYIRGLAGSDEVAGHEGEDDVGGGPGADYVSEDQTDVLDLHLACGHDQDTFEVDSFWWLAERRVVPKDCERVALSGLIAVGAHPDFTRRSIGMRVICMDRYYVGCRYRVEVTRPNTDRPLARGGFDLVRGERRWVRIPFTRSGLQIRRKAGMRARFLLTHRTGHGYDRFTTTLGSRR